MTGIMKGGQAPWPPYETHCVLAWSIKFFLTWTATLAGTLMWFIKYYDVRHFDRHAGRKYSGCFVSTEPSNLFYKHYFQSPIADRYEIHSFDYRCVFCRYAVI
jgi:hypothetical protein